MKPTVFLSHRRDVDLMRCLQRLQRRNGVVVVKHRTLADRLKCSESTVRRAIERLVAAGHVYRTYMARTMGGLICVYRVRTDVIYRHASTFRRAKAKLQVAPQIESQNEQLVNARKDRPDGHFGHPSTLGNARVLQINHDNKRHMAHSSLSRSFSREEKRPDLLPGLLSAAKAIGIDDCQRGYLKGAALRYGVIEAWRALQIAYEEGYPLPDLVKVAWGILKRQFPKEVPA